MNEEALEKSATLEIAELWKFFAVITLSCFISWGGEWLTDNDKYLTESQVKEIIAAKNAVIELEMKHAQANTLELKRVVENNNNIMQGLKEEFISMRQEIKHITKTNE